MSVKLRHTGAGRTSAPVRLHVIDSMAEVKIDGDRRSATMAVISRKDPESVDVVNKPIAFRTGVCQSKGNTVRFMIVPAPTLGLRGYLLIDGPIIMSPGNEDEIEVQLMKFDATAPDLDARDTALRVIPLGADADCPQIIAAGQASMRPGGASAAQAGASAAALSTHSYPRSTGGAAASAAKTHAFF